MLARLKKIFGGPKPAQPRPLLGQPGYTPGTILFVDDEPEARTIAKLALEPHHYKIIEASNGEEALAIYAKHQAEIGLLVTDVLMPKLDGLGLCRQIHKIDSSLPVLLLSGHVLEEDLWAPGNARMRYLMKPYKIQDLQDAVVDLIGAVPASKNT